MAMGAVPNPPSPANAAAADGRGHGRAKFFSAQGLGVEKAPGGAKILSLLTTRPWYLPAAGPFFETGMASPQRVTALLDEWSRGDRAALDELIPLVEAELHRLARSHMRRERAGHTLQTTAVVNEAYIRLAEWEGVRWENRAHFFGIAAEIMRRIMIDHARRRQQLKRGGAGAVRVTLDEGALRTDERGAELLALDEALSELTEKYPRKGRVVELRYFGGLSVEEAAEVLRVDARTVKRDWTFARAWLHNRLSGGGESTSRV
jgi:RNA polymerase sigma-70 factor (ECF subfamily)